MKLQLPENRAELEQLIEAAIDMLDRLDPDPDLEDGFDDEPWLGALEGNASYGFGTIWLNTTRDDLEDQCDDEGSGDEAHNGSLGHQHCGPVRFVIAA